MKLHFLFLFLFANVLIEVNASEIQYVFKNHQEGYHVYRIPTIIKTKGNNLLAFCEGRRSLFDNGNIDIVMKTSKDNGKTWSKLKVVWDNGKNTCGNPSPVINNTNGNVIVLATMNNDKVFVLESKDEGESWEQPKEITTSVKLNNWQWYATGPVHAIQLEQKKNINRILVPCNHTILGNKNHVSHVIYSDDAGFSWKLGGSVPGENTDESTVAELLNRDLLLNMRNNEKSISKRKISISKDGGETWTSPIIDSTLIEPICQGSLLRYSFSPNILLFSNPLNKNRRKNLTISVSYNEGKNWTKRIFVFKKKSAYSDMVKLNNGDIVCLFEFGKMLPYRGVLVKIIDNELIME
ncbi:MAG: exo-alpha-sialidase [Bacteroidetes bacterium]|nr:exo-alpha-sialidase [Bacteroidota bacterium]